MRLRWLLATATIVFAGCGGHTGHGNPVGSRLSGQAVQAAFRQQGFRIVSDEQLATMDDAQLIQYEHDVFGAPTNSVKERASALDDGKKDRASGIVELFGAVLGAKSSTDAVSASIWRTEPEAKASVARLRREIAKVEKLPIQRVALPIRRVGNVIIQQASAKPSPGLVHAVHAVEEHLARTN